MCVYFSLLSELKVQTHVCRWVFVLCKHSLFLLCVSLCVCVCVCVGSPADGILYPGDQVLQINDTVLEDLSTEQVENILR